MPKKKVTKLFGVKLDPHKPTVPEHLEFWLTELEKRGGLETEGLFRVSGSVAQIRKLRENVEEGDMDFNDFTVHDLAGLIKMFFRELPEPLFTTDLYGIFVAAGASNNKEEMSQALHLLPAGHRVVLYRLLSFLSKVVALSKVNKMTPENLATCLVPNLLRAKEEKVEATITDYPFQISLFTVIIENYELFFKKDIEETQRKKDAAKEKALNYKKMMEQKYKKPAAEPPKENNNSAPSTSQAAEESSTPAEPTRPMLIRAETKEELDFKQEMNQKYQRIKANTLKRLEHQRDLKTAMEFKVMLEDQFQRIQSGEINPDEIRELLQVKNLKLDDETNGSADSSKPSNINNNPSPSNSNKNSPSNSNNSSPSNSFVKPYINHLRKVEKAPVHRTLPTQTAQALSRRSLEDKPTPPSSQSHIEVSSASRNRSWTAFDSDEPNPNDIKELLQTLPPLPQSLEVLDKLPKQSPKPPPRPPRSNAGGSSFVPRPT